jgi:cyclopropane fatty-acyl-phospholipid synthase-like methyltransferase
MQSHFTVPEDWYENFFTAPVNHFWERMVPPEAARADAGFVTRHIGAPPPAHLLDIPCGAGRHALALAESGYRVTGVDLSADAVARASEAAGARSLPARFVRNDMRRFRLDAPADGIVCLGNSIGYSGIDGMAEFFVALAGNLRTGGRLILDSHVCAESLFPIAPERELRFEGGSYSAELRYDVMRSSLQTRALLRLGDEVHELLYAHQVVTSGELVRLLQGAGLRTLEMCADTDGAPYAAGSPRLLLVAERLGS